MDFACPKCKGELTLDGNTKKCKNNHCFDRAKAGYYNLLLGARGGTHGDNTEMVEARRSFLSRGFYAPLADKISSLVKDVLPRGGCVLDAGCGEGYYTDKVEKALFERDGESNVLGFDISRDAVKCAHRRNAAISLAVATAYDMPIKDASLDVIFNVFSPLAIGEVRRVLCRGGKFIMAYPGPDHLFGLKSVIYATPYKNEPEEAGIEGFKLISHETLKYDIKLDTPEDIRALFMMTPYAYRTSKEDRERVLLLPSVTTEVEFIIDTYEKM